MNRALGVSLVLLVASGCARQTIRQRKYLESMAALKGQRIEQVIGSWGPPDRVYRVSEHQTMYTWVQDGGIRYASSRIGGATFGSAYSSTCKTTLTVGAWDVVEQILLDGACGPIPH